MSSSSSKSTLTCGGEEGSAWKATCLGHSSPAPPIQQWGGSLFRPHIVHFPLYTGWWSRCSATVVFFFLLFETMWIHPRALQLLIQGWHKSNTKKWAHCVPISQWWFARFLVFFCKCLQVCALVWAYFLARCYRPERKLWTGELHRNLGLATARSQTIHSCLFGLFWPRVMFWNL